MKQLVMDCLEELNKSRIIKPLIEGEIFIMQLTCEKEKYYIELKDSNFNLLTNIDVNPDIFMEGNKNCLQSILLGKVLLRKSKEDKSLQISSTIRKLLLLESLFYLINMNKTAV